MTKCAHGPEACCTLCTVTTDGYGFSHPSERNGRVALQQCRHCGKWVPKHEWVHDIRGARFGCVGCLAPDS